MKYKGKTHKFGDDVNTDDIIPAKYLHLQDAEELAKYCMEHHDRHFVKKVKKGDIVVAGKNFGCGSSREHAPLALKGCGVSCVIAKSFARIFYRNAINIGLPIVVSCEASKEIKPNDLVEVDTGKGIIRNISRKKEYKTDIYPPFIQRVISRGGLMKAI